MSMLDKIGAAISKGDLDEVCSLFNKMTGRSISVVKEIPFDHTKAKKAQLVEKLDGQFPKEMLVGLSIKELRELYGVNVHSPQESVQKEVRVSTDSGDSSFYVPPDKAGRLLNMDKRKIPVRLDDFKSYGDEREPTQKEARPNKLVNASCVKCNKSDQVNEILLIAGAEGGPKFLCPKCYP